MSNSLFKLPSRRQIGGWTIPSQSSYWGFWVGVISFWVTVISFIFAVWIWQYSSDTEPISKIAAKATEAVLETAREHNVNETTLRELSKAVDALRLYSGVDEDEKKDALKLWTEGNDQKARKIFERLAHSSSISSSQSAEMYRYLGAIDFFRDPEASHNSYKRAMELDPSSGDGWTQFGHLNLQMERIEAAEKAYMNALEIALKSNDAELEVMSLGNLGTIQLKQNNFFQAEKMIRRALDLDNRSGRLCGIADGYNNLGYIYIHRYNPDIALEFFNKSYDLYKKCHDEKKSASVAKNIRAAEETKSENLQARERCNRFLEKFFNIDRNTPDGTTYCRAESLRQAGQLLTAEHLFNDLRSRHLEEGNKFSAVWDYVGLGDTSIDLKKFAEGIQLYREALTLAKESGSQFQLAHIYLRIADEDRESCRFQNALVSYENAVTIFGRIGMIKEASDIQSYTEFFKIGVELAASNALDSISGARSRCSFERER